MSVTTEFGVLETALANVIKKRHLEGRYGVVVEGLPQVAIRDLVAALGGPGQVFVSLIAAPDADNLVSWARAEGWDELGFGVSSTHAVRVRNEAPPESVKVAFVWREEERLHSLTQRGYEAVGPQDVLVEICRLASEQVANAPDRHLWESLASSALAPYLSLDGVLRYYIEFFSEGYTNDLETPRRLLPLLGFLQDSELLTGKYSKALDITKRLTKNAEMVRRLQRGEEEDRRKAASVVRGSEDSERERLRVSYNAFLRMARNDSDALNDLTLTDAERLLSGKASNTEGNDPPPDGTDEDDDGGQGSTPPPTRRPFSSLAVAAVQLTIEGKHEIVGQLIEGAVRSLERDDIQDERILGDGVAVEFSPDPRAVTVCRAVTEAGRLGGRLDAQEQPLDIVLRDLNSYVEDFIFFDDVELRTLEEYLQRAQTVLTGFEGRALVGEYLGHRAALVRFRDLLASSPLACLVAQEDARQAVQQAVGAYERLLSHLEQNFAELRRAASEGAVFLYNKMLSIDMIHIRGDDERAALLSPLHPLVLWKYLELAQLVLDRGADLPESDKELLADEVADIPEPLLAIYAPSDHPNEPLELGYATRIGSIPVYRPISVVAADLSEGTLQLSGAKLAALYPPAKTNLNVLLVDPVSTQDASKAMKRLLDKGGFERATLLVARTRPTADGEMLPPDRTLDELSSQNRVTVEQLPLSPMDHLAEYVAQRPVHLLAVAGERRKNVELIDSEETRLHPLSFPHKIHADPLLGKVSLRPRSMKPVEGGPQHPFGIYQSLIAEISGNPRSEFSVRDTQHRSLQNCRPLLPYTQFLLMTGELPDGRPQHGLLRLTQGAALGGDAVFTQYTGRIVHGMDSLLRQLHYRPSSSGLEELLERLQEIGGEGIFSTISEKGSRGFSETALRGQLGLAVALNWYRSQTAGERQVLLSLDGYLARRWLQKRDDAKRTDLLGIRETVDGALAMDVIEVKSYEATDEGDITDAHPSQQLRSVAKVMYDMLHQQGDILIDRRRELLRLQVFREGLANKATPDADWVETLNEILDGDRQVEINLILVELAFDSNIPLQDQLFPPAANAVSPADRLPIRRLRLGEQDIQRYLDGLVEREQGLLPPMDAAQQDHDDPGDSGGDPQAPQTPIDNVPLESEDEQVATSPGGDESATGLVADQQAGETAEALGFEPSESERAEIAETARAIYRVLQDIGVRLAAEVDPDLADVGPSVIRYKVRLRTGERVSNLQNRARDLMRELAAPKEPIIDNLPGTNFVYIDLPRPQRRPAYYRPFLERLGRREENQGVWCPIGLTPDGQVEWLDITALPHMLVAGSTGAGKTMFLYSLIVGLAHYYNAQELEFVLIDPKQTDFVFFNQLPHLRQGRVITDPREAIEVLMQLLTGELTSRTEVLTRAMARDIRGYNARHPQAPIKPIVVVIDEFADLADVMSRTERDNFDLALRRLAQRARNVGIHLILATQRPTTDIVNGTLKSNLPCRVSFRLASQVDSRTILDQGGAEHLLGQGDMLVGWNGRILRLQGFYLPDEDIARLLGPVE